MLRRSESWAVRSAAAPGTIEKDWDHELATMPNTMLLHSSHPYVDLLEEPPNHYSPVHFHTEPEVMVVVRGRMMVNGEWCDVGSVIVVPENEEYWHATGDEGCLVAVIRPTERGLLVPGTDTRAARQPSSASDGSVLTPMDRNKIPHRIALQAGKTYFWCACGRSGTQPLCDGSHRGTGIEPLPCKLPLPMTVALCGCKRSLNPPFCDGSHAKVGVVSRTTVSPV
jgi:CDGSH-type Zn-finger protein